MAEQATNMNTSRDGKVDLGTAILAHQLEQKHREVTLSVNGEDGMKINCKYEIEAVSCHIRLNQDSGHYVALRFEENGSVTYCDDREVYDLSKMLATNNSTLAKFCRENSLSGLVYILRRINS